MIIVMLLQCVNIVSACVNSEWLAVQCSTNTAGCELQVASETARQNIAKDDEVIIIGRSNL